MAEENKKGFSGIAGFFKSVKKEFRRIVWPNKEKVTRETIAVLIISVLLGGLIAALDFGFYTGLGMIIK